MWIEIARSALIEGAAKADAVVVPDERKHVQGRKRGPRIADLLASVGIRRDEDE
jgi:hypothetical protein